LDHPVQAKAQIGYLPEIPPLYEDMTVDEYLEFVCELKGIRKKADKKNAVEEVEEAVKIVDVRNRLIRNLSKGYKQRVGLAQALIGNPPLLILDEPTVGLDPNQIIEIRSLIKSLAGKHTIILSSHILSEVNAICDYVMIIDKGRLVAEDTPEALSGHFSDQNRLILSVKGEQSVVEETLQGLEMISSYEVTSVEEGIVHVQAKTDSKEDVRDELFFAFAEKKLPLIHMETEKMTLEDVFMKLTGQDAEEVESEAEKASKQIEKQRHSIFGKKKNDSEEEKTL
jgi:ABC-2 type transport system ATP-binding protein